MSINTSMKLNSEISSQPVQKIEEKASPRKELLYKVAKVAVAATVIAALGTVLWKVLAPASYPPAGCAAFDGRSTVCHDGKGREIAYSRSMDWPEAKALFEKMDTLDAMKIRREKLEAEISDISVQDVLQGHDRCDRVGAELRCSVKGQESILSIPSSDQKLNSFWNEYSSCTVSRGRLNCTGEAGKSMDVESSQLAKQIRTIHQTYGSYLCDSFDEPFDLESLAERLKKNDPATTATAYWFKIHARCGGDTEDARYRDLVKNYYSDKVESPNREPSVTVVTPPSKAM